MPTAAANSKRKARVGELPWIEPIRAIRRPEPFDHPDWIFELKYDGYRGLLYIEPNRPRIISRNANEFTRFRTLAEAIARDLKAGEAILDGEVVCLDGQGRPQFNELLFGRGTPSYMAFDLESIS